MSNDRFHEQLVDFALNLKWEDAPQTTRDVLKLSLQDWIAVALAGVDEPVGLALRNMLLNEGGIGAAYVFGAGVKMPARSAALANGTTSHALDYDDTHFLHIGHPSVVIFSAALAVAEHVDASGRAFLEAALLGFESSCRIGHWLGRAHYDAGFHMTATAGCFGAALAAARLLGADQGQMNNALGLASTRSSGLKAQFGSMGKPYNAGLAAANGVEAALLAVGGMSTDGRGITSFAEGHAGMMDETALTGLGKEFVTESISHKFHACCHGTHAALEALAKLDVEAREVIEVLISVNPRWLSVCNQQTPSSGLEAKFSYRMCAAMAMAGLDTGVLSTFIDPHYENAKLCALRDLVQVQGDADLTDGMARVLVTRHGGMTRQATYDLDQPMDIETRRQRVHAKAGALIGDAKAQNILRQVELLDQADHLVGLVGALA